MAAKGPLLEKDASPGAVTSTAEQQRTSFLRQLSEGAGPGSSMEWTDLSFSIKGKNILHNVSGSVLPGEMACILGPSGAGKSTLLNILAGRMDVRKPGMEFSGAVSIGGAAVEPVKVRSKIAYVMQDDALPPMSTPRELLQMSAILRLPGARSTSDVTSQVSELLSALGLDKCADTYVGSQLVKGISGGEKKRTAVAVELITKPRMIFLDEPLSGLDSYAAWTVVQVCKELASHGCAVLCTIHQPSSEIFQAFTKVICLADGGTAYCGPVADLNAYMERVGRPVPSNYNPADHILFQVQTLEKNELGSFMNLWAEQEKVSVLPRIQEARAPGGVLEVPRAARQKSFFVQLRFLVHREIRSTLRDRLTLVARFVVNGIMGILFACIFQGIGNKPVGTPGAVQSHFGAVCNIMIGTMFGSTQPLLLQFPVERPVFLREYAANMYGTVPYFMAKMLVELPLTFLTALETILISYWIMGFQGNFIFLVLISWGLALTAASTALLIGCNIAQVQRVQEFAPLVFVPQIIFSGIFISINLVPVWMRWLQYAAALKYAINLACIVELGNIEGGDVFLASQDIDKDKVWLYIGILAGIFVVFRFLAMLGLRKNATFVY